MSGGPRRHADTVGPRVAPAGPGPARADRTSIVTGGRGGARLGPRSPTPTFPSSPGQAGRATSARPSLGHQEVDITLTLGTGPFGPASTGQFNFAHPRDPYHRVDVQASSRHVVVRHDGQVVAESHRPKLLFETGLPVRYYLPPADVRTERLAPSGTVSDYPYKGPGQHWHLAGGDGALVEDAAWSLPFPLPEGLAAGQHLCFYPDKVDVEVDGERLVA